jgi:hypothetical protein
VSLETTCITGKEIMVERAMYWNSRGAGTDTIGGYSRQARFEAETGNTFIEPHNRCDGLRLMAVERGK